MAEFNGLFEVAIHFAVLLYLAALGELICERAGVLNLGVEGMIAIGAAVGLIVSIESGNVWLALVAAIIAGALTAALHGLLTVVLGADQVVSGLALTILGLGLAAFIGGDYVGRTPTKNGSFAKIDIPGLGDIPVVGDVVFRQPAMFYLAILAGIATWFVLSRTRVGLGLRAAGESAATADAAGHSVASMRFVAVTVGGAFAGAAGAYLTLFLTKGWSDGVVAGRGWIAVALVIFGSWRPGRVALGAFIFGLTLALQPRLQTMGVDISPVLLSMLPYVLTLAAMVVFSIQSRNRPSSAPAALGIAFHREER